MKSRTLHFRVDFDGITNRAREMWAEGEYQRAFSVLTVGCNLQPEQATRVLNGTAKLAQDPDGTEGCDGLVVEDNWNPGDKFGFYPEASCPVLAAECAKLTCENERLRDELASANNCVDDEPPETINQLAARLSPVDAFVQRQLELDRRPDPKPDNTFEADNGWVTRDGKFWPCAASMEHIWLAGRLGKTEGEAEDAGWVKLATPMLGTYVISKKAPTKRQISTVFGWSEKRPNRQRPAKEWLECWSR